MCTCTRASAGDGVLVFNVPCARTICSVLVLGVVLVVILVFVAFRSAIWDVVVITVYTGWLVLVACGEVVATLMDRILV